MSKLLLSLLAGTSLMCLSSCETGDYDDDDDDRPQRTTTTVTEETTVTPSTLVPISGSVQTQTVRTY